MWSVISFSKSYLQLESVLLLILFYVLIQFPQLGFGQLQLSLSDPPVAGDLVPFQLKIVSLISLPI